jgi:ankyrin repeat protein
MRALRKYGAALGVAVAMAFSGLAAAQPAEAYATIAEAAAHNSTEQVKELLDTNEGDPDAIDARGFSALDYAAAYDNVAMAKLLLEHHARVDGRNKDRETPLHFAAERGALAMVEFLIANKASLDAPDRQGITPLMGAAANGQVAAVRLLMAAGANPHKNDYTGRDAVAWAKGQPAMLRALAAKE